MRLLSRLLWVFALLAFPTFGCAEVAPETAPLTLRVSGEGLQGEPRAALEGAQLCETGTTNCALSDTKGKVTIELPVRRESSYTLEKEGYASYLVPGVTPANGYDYEFEMATDQYFGEQYARLMAAYPMRGTGSILLELQPPFAGATLELVGATGKAYYNEEEGPWSPDLTATTSWGWGGFVEVSRGEFQAAYGGTAERCLVASLGWPGNLDNSVRFPVLEGYTTVAIMNCPPP